MKDTHDQDRDRDRILESGGAAWIGQRGRFALLTVAAVIALVLMAVLVI